VAQTGPFGQNQLFSAETTLQPVSFFNLYSHNFIRAAVAIPEVRVADPAFNAAQTIALMDQAAEQRAVLAVFPELGLSAYSCEDLFHQQALLDGSKAALEKVLEASRNLALVSVVGLPLQVDGLLYNCAAVLARGKILGLAPKTYLPNYREFYELRQFTPGDFCARETVDLCGQVDVPFGYASTVPSRRPAAAQYLRRDLRGSVDTDPALLTGGAGGRHSSGQCVRVQYYRGQR
jgi:hypothetical protein